MSVTLQEAFAAADVCRSEGKCSFRSCVECNPAHTHLHSREFLFVCFGCGNYWYGLWNLTQERQIELPKEEK